MATHKLILDDFFEEAFSLIAIHTTLPDYRLAYFLNKELCVNLIQVEKLNNHSFFEFNDQVNQTNWNLVKNKGVEQNNLEDKKQNLFGFDDSKSIVYLVPEYKKVDFLLIIDPFHLQEENIISKIKTIPQIITTFVIETENLKSKNNLIFQ